MSDLLERMRGFESDHEPNGWPAVQMRDISALCDRLEQAEARVAELEAKAIKLSNDEAMLFDDVVYLVRALRQSSRGKEIIERAAGSQPMGNDLRDYLEDVGLLPVSAERRGWQGREGRR